MVCASCFLFDFGPDHQRRTPRTPANKPFASQNKSKTLKFARAPTLKMSPIHSNSPKGSVLHSQNLHPLSFSCKFLSKHFSKEHFYCFKRIIRYVQINQVQKSGILLYPTIERFLNLFIFINFSFCYNETFLLFCKQKLTFKPLVMKQKNIIWIINWKKMCHCPAAHSLALDLHNETRVARPLPIPVFPIQKKKEAILFLVKMKAIFPTLSCAVKSCGAAGKRSDEKKKN